MRTRLFIASVWTLSLLFGMLAAVVLLFLYTQGVVNVWLVLAMTVVLNFLAWLFSPRITDWIQKFFYKAVYFDQASFTQAYPQYAAFINETTQKNKTPFPKIGFINDDNPTAYSYGSGKWNSRVVFTQGVLTYLEEDEVKAVLAHELGHIVHRDFIVMSIANTIIQLLYEIYYLTAHSKGKDKESSKLAYIGLIAYIFYFIGTYIVLYLNRLREYYADEFSAQTTGDGDALENALVKIAYGIMAKEDSESSQRLLESTKTMGIMSLQSAKGAALAMKVTNMQPDKVANVMLFDVVSPWAKLAEIGATHPLTGKRLLRLEQMGQAAGKRPRFDLEAARASAQINKSRLWLGFLFGSFMYFLPTLVILASAGVVFYEYNHKTHPALVAPVLAVSVFVLLVLRIFYQYPLSKKAPDADIYSLMTDIYANPLHGKPVALNGTIVGRGVPGYMFGEDMMMQDKTGILYLDYQGGIPLISNLVFALKRFKKFLGQEVAANGWFFRSNTQYLRLKKVRGTEGTLRSYPRFWGILTSLICALILGSVVYYISPIKNQVSAYNDANKNPYQYHSPYSGKPIISQTVGGYKQMEDQCYSWQVPQNASASAIDPCDMAFETSDYSGGNLYSQSYKIVAHPQAGSFASSIANWKITNKPIRGAEQISQVIFGLPAYSIVYTDTQTGATMVTYLVDSSSRIIINGQPYYTEFTYNDQPQLQYIMNNVFGSVKVKSYVPIKS